MPVFIQSETCVSNGFLKVYTSHMPLSGIFLPIKLIRISHMQEIKICQEFRSVLKSIRGICSNLFINNILYYKQYIYPQ